MNFKFFRKKTELDLETLNKFHANSNFLDNSVSHFLYYTPVLQKVTCVAKSPTGTER